MRQCRIVSDNAADRAVLSVSNAVPAMGAALLKTNIKGEVCRVLGDTTTIEATWPQLETVACVALPACSLSADATIRVRIYDATDALAVDTGVRWAVPGSIIEHWDFSQPLNVNAFAEGAALAQVWFEHVATRRVVIDITDPGAPLIDIARLVVGRYFAPQYGPSWGPAVGTLDMSKNSRAASGDLRNDWAPRARTLQFDLEHIVDADRARVRQLLDAGVGRWLFISLLAGDSDPVREQDHSIYGKPASTSAMSYVNAVYHSTKIQLEGW